MFFLEVSAKNRKNLELVQKVLRIRSSHIIRKAGNAFAGSHEYVQKGSPRSNHRFGEELNSGKKTIISSIGKNSGFDSGSKNFSINNDAFLHDVMGFEDQQETYQKSYFQDAYNEGERDGFGEAYFDSSAPPKLPPRELEDYSLNRSPQILQNSEKTEVSE